MENIQSFDEFELNEGNPFIFAAAKAKAEGKKEFTFNGKTYPVKMKKDILKKDKKKVQENLELNEKVKSMQAYLQGVLTYVSKGGGNMVNLRDNGLFETAELLDTYSSSKHSTDSEVIYTTDTLNAFQELVYLMGEDEVNNNQG